MYFSWLKRFPTSRKQLGPSGGRTADANAADLINSDLSSGEQDGYRFTLSATKAGWIVRAVPLRDTIGGIQTTYTIESRVFSKTLKQPNPRSVIVSDNGVSGIGRGVPTTTLPHQLASNCASIA